MTYSPSSPIGLIYRYECKYDLLSAGCSGHGGGHGAAGGWAGLYILTYCLF